MNRKRNVFILLFLFSYTLLWAQEWTKEDSIWLQNVLEGKETLIINEDTKKAIEDGRLTMPSWMKNMDNEWELNKDFDDGERPDSIKIRRLNPYTMPPAVFALYIFYLDKLDSAYRIQSLIINEDEQKQLEALLPTGTSPFYPYTHDYSPGFTVGGMDFNHALSMVFSTEYRRLMHSRRHAKAYKYINGEEVNQSFAISEKERKQLIKSVNSYRQSTVFSINSRKSGIDD